MKLLQEKRDELAEQHYKKTGWVPTEFAVMNFQAGWDACAKECEKINKKLEVHIELLLAKEKQNQIFEDAKAQNKNNLWTNSIKIQLNTEKEYDAILEDTKLKIEGDFRKEIAGLKTQLQYEKDALAAMKEHYDSKLEIAKEALQEIKCKSSIAKMYNLEIYRCPTCDSAEIAAQALKDLESAGE